MPNQRTSHGLDGEPAFAREDAGADSVCLYRSGIDSLGRWVRVVEGHSQICQVPTKRLLPKFDATGHVLIFTHVPKSAGTSLDHVLSGMAAVRGLRFRRAMGTLYGIFPGAGKGDAPADFAHLQSDVLERLDIVSGHLPFGGHARLTHPAFYMTILREPMARLVSHSVSASAAAVGRRRDHSTTSSWKAI